MGRAERPLLFEAPAGYDDPLEMLLGCHRRIEKHLEMLKRLRAHVEHHGVDAQASVAAQAVLAYFTQAVVNHHQDEEHDLFPLLESRITDPGELARFHAFRRALEEDHRNLDAAWSRLRRPLEGIADGLTRALPLEDTQGFHGAYARHIVVEESTLKEFFDRWLGDADRVVLGRAMAARRASRPAGS
jgi:hemerythrin-like domain-containing protein